MLQASSHLFCARRSEDGPSDASVEETITYEASKSGFMARTPAANDGNVVRLGERGGVAVDNFVGSVKQERWVGKGEGVEGGQDGMSGISEIVLSCWDEMSVPEQLGKMKCSTVGDIPDIFMRANMNPCYG